MAVSILFSGIIRESGRKKVSYRRRLETTSTRGIVFDIKQLAVFDGPGIRTTVFLKGCPLRCEWCHNPEGLSFRQQLMVSENGCLHCNQCLQVCQHKDHCELCGECVRICPLHLRKICGISYTAEELAKKLWREKEILEMNGGGITISGGEPTGQPEFLLELLERLKGMHRAIETCGHCKTEVFSQVLDHLEYAIMDIKLVDTEQHKRWTGQDNHLILKNLEQLKGRGIPFMIRIPLIPGVNDTDQNMEATAKLLADAKTLEKVELLPYHQTAGAKYSMVNRTYQVHFDTSKEVHVNTEIFKQWGITSTVL